MNRRQSTADRGRLRYKIHDAIYDVTDFAKVHPGGVYVFRDLKPDTNITPMIYAYHRNPNSILAMLHTYKISHAGSIRYDTNHTYDKYCELKKLVYDEIGEKKIPLYWSYCEIAYNACMLFVYLAMLLYFYMNPNTTSVGYILFLSIMRAGSPGALFHETAHFIGFKSQKLNRWMSDYLLLDLFIANEWRFGHNYVHHSFTNTIHDADLHIGRRVLRYSPTHALS
jgi:hypothetical protein